MNINEPANCTEAERREFERLVREGFRGSDAGLPDRIGRAKLLGFSVAADGSVVGIAGLKAPGEAYRREVFEKAAVTAAPEDYGLELGWIYVIPAHRGKGIGEALCRRLLDGPHGTGVYATTRPDNAPMIAILDRLGMERVGRPFRRRDEDMVVFLATGE